jgi:hypothetical protein
VATPISNRLKQMFELAITFFYHHHIFVQSQIMKRAADLSSPHRSDKKICPGLGGQCVKDALELNNFGKLLEV